MRAFLTPQLDNHKKHVIMFDGNLTEDRKVGIFTSLREFIGLAPYEGEDIARVADVFLFHCVQVKDFTFKTAATSPELWDMEYHGGGSYCEKSQVVVHQFNNETKTLKQMEG